MHRNVFILSLIIGICFSFATPIYTIREFDKPEVDEVSDSEKIPHRILSRQTIVDSSGNALTLWTQMHECIAYTPIVDAIQIVNRGYNPTGVINVHQAPGDLFFWCHDLAVYNLENGPAVMPTSIASDDGSYSIGPHISFNTVFSPGVFLSGAQYESGSWWSSYWDAPVDLGVGDAHYVIGKQLSDGNILSIVIAGDFHDSLLYCTYSPDLQTSVAQGLLADDMEYWGYDFNGGIAYVFFYDDSFNVYYRTTIDGISWSAEQSYNVIWPEPYTTNRIDWMQCAVTDAGDPILVFDNRDYMDAQWPYYSKVYVSYGSGDSCIEVSSTFGAPDTECYYPTITTGGNMAAVLYCMPRNNEPDSLNWWDFYLAWSTDNGLTWGTPQNVTSDLTVRPGMQQLAKRIDTLRNRVYYVYAVDLVVNHDPLWHFWYDPEGLDPMGICFDYGALVGIEEQKQNLACRTLKLTAYPNPFYGKTDIQWQIADKNEFDLAIYDITGRLIRYFGHFSTGASCSAFCLWEGDDDFGRQVQAGIYFVRIETATESMVKKIIKTK